MFKSDSWIDNKIVQNLILWSLLLLIISVAITAENKLLASLFVIVLLAPPIYINNLIILPYLNKSRSHFFLLFLLNTVVFTGVSVIVIGLILGEPQWNAAISLFAILVLALLFGSAIKIARDGFMRRHQEKEAELKLLKAQLNPHFLFNTLNNLYGLSVIKSDKLPDLMLKLSNLLRYSLYETKETFVPLEKEIQYLENYIALEKIRLEDQTEIKFSKSIGISSVEIAPMLLIVFVENSFKHLGELENKKNKVLVDLVVDNEQLVFKCINTIDHIDLNEQHLEKGKSGIGLQNAKKRLNLMYPNRHQLLLNKDKENYIVELILNF